MLASITPLGERSRGFSWSLTAAAFAAGALVAGAAAGAAAGALGSLAGLGAGARGALLAAVLALALAFDATPLSRVLPSTRRQVNEDWLGRYRGWVYGLGFGLQLGTGLATIVTSASVYAAAAAAFICSSAAGGLAIGAAFGATRGLSLLLARSARTPGALVALHRRLARLQRASALAVPGVEAALLALAAVSLAT